MQFQTYSREWSEHYSEKGLRPPRPDDRLGLSTNGTVRWSALPVPDTFGILDDAASFGMKYGVAFSIGPISSRTIGGVTRGDREFTDSEIDEISKIIRQLHDITEPRIA